MFVKPLLMKSDLETRPYYSPLAQLVTFDTLKSFDIRVQQPNIQRKTLLDLRIREAELHHQSPDYTLICFFLNRGSMIRKTRYQSVKTAIFRRARRFKGKLL